MRANEKVLELLTGNMKEFTGFLTGSEQREFGANGKAPVSLIQLQCTTTLTAHKLMHQ